MAPHTLHHAQSGLAVLAPGRREEAMTMAVVTISREYGSEGIYIGKKVASALGYRFADKRIIENNAAGVRSR